MKKYKLLFSEINLYHIKIIKPKFLWFKDVLEYILSYSISEDRILFKKIENGRLLDEHHTKNNLTNSIKIMHGIKERYEKIYYDEIKSDRIKFFYSVYGKNNDEKIKLGIIKDFLNQKMEILNEQRMFTSSDKEREFYK